LWFSGYTFSFYLPPPPPPPAKKRFGFAGGAGGAAGAAGADGVVASVPPLAGSQRSEAGPSPQ